MKNYQVYGVNEIGGRSVEVVTPFVYVEAKNKHEAQQAARRQCALLDWCDRIKVKEMSERPEPREVSEDECN